MKLTFISTAAVKGRTAEYAFVESPFGSTLLAVYEGAICYMNFPQNKANGLAALKRYWKGGTLTPAKDGLKALGKKIFSGERESLSLLLAGTPFQHQVWKALSNVPEGKTVSYGELAAKAGKPGAARAVGGAVGANPVVYLLACHRILASDGSLNGFGCGLPLKQKLLTAEGHGKLAA
jgi:O-6-methylguanine DNA methyltransferase